MKKYILWGIFGIFGILAVSGIAGAVILYPTHGANGTSVGYYTMILFPTAFILLGLTGIGFRYWWIPTGVLWLGLAWYLLTLPGTSTGFLILLAAYLILSLAAGISGRLLRRQFSSPK